MNDNVLSRPLRHISLVIVLYAVVDIVWTYFRISHAQGLTVADAATRGSDVDFEYTPVALVIMGPLPLLVASIFVLLRNRWTLIGSTVISLLMLYRGVRQLLDIGDLVFFNSQQQLLRNLKWWWTFGGGGWDLIRLGLFAVILIYACVLLFVAIKHWSFRPTSQ